MSPSPRPAPQLFYSVPFLEQITRLDLFYSATSRKTGRISVDNRSGDFIEYSGPLDISLRTFFHFRKPLPPRLDPTTEKKPIPAQPVPASAWTLPGAWMWGGAALSGSQLDAMGQCPLPYKHAGRNPLSRRERRPTLTPSRRTQTTAPAQSAPSPETTTRHMGQTARGPLQETRARPAKAQRDRHQAHGSQESRGTRSRRARERRRVFRSHECVP